MKSWKSPWNYKLDKLHPWDQLAGYRLDGWSARWAGNWLKGCTQRLVMVIRVCPALVPTAQERHRKMGEGPEECHDLTSEQWQKEISSLERTILRGISCHVSSNCSWVATKRTVFLRNFHSENNHSLEQHCMVMVEPPPLDVFQMWQGRFLHNPLLAALLTKGWVEWTLDISSNVGYSVQMKS